MIGKFGVGFCSAYMKYLEGRDARRSAIAQRDEWSRSMEARMEAVEAAGAQLAAQQAADRERLGARQGELESASNQPRSSVNRTVNVASSKGGLAAEHSAWTEDQSLDMLHSRTRELVSRVAKGWKYCAMWRGRPMYEVWLDNNRANRMTAKDSYDFWSERLDGDTSPEAAALLRELKCLC